MALARIKTWVSGEVLLASDLNSEFNNLLNNSLTLISPLTASLNAGGFKITNYGGTDAPTSVTDVALNAFVQSGAGASTRTLQTKMREVVSIKDFGAVGDGATDDDTAKTNWLVACAGKLGYVNEGTYLVGSVAVPANTKIYGAGNKVSVFKAKALLNNPVVTLGTNSDITLVDFGIEGNSAAQGGGPGTASGLTLTNGNRIRCENIRINDCQDWGFAFFQGSDVRLTNCTVTNLKGGVNANSVRGAYLLGDGSAITSCDDVVMTACTASGTGTTIFYDGFMSEVGFDHRFIGCQATVPYTAFKLKGNRVTVQGCYAGSGCTAGFQTQTSTQGLVLTGNTAYRCLNAGFQFNQADTVTPARNWIITGNLAIENGQDAAAPTPYAFAFEPAATATIDHCTFTGNMAVDNQGVATQLRGVSFGGTGSCTNFTITGNTAKGHANDYVDSAILDHTTAVIGQNNFTTGSQGMWAVPAMGAYRLHFWTDNAAAGAGTTSMLDGLSGRGYVMPRAGYVRTQYVRSTAAVTAGTINFLPKKNAGALSSNISMTSGTFASRDETPKQATFAAGDIITCVFNSTAGLLPAGTNDFDLVVEVVYND